MATTTVEIIWFIWPIPTVFILSIMMSKCSSRCMAVAIMLVSLTSFLLSLLMSFTGAYETRTENRDTDPCGYWDGYVFRPIFQVGIAPSQHCAVRVNSLSMISAILVEGPSASWLLTMASTPYLKQVSRYLFVVWMAQWWMGHFDMLVCREYGNASIDLVWRVIVLLYALMHMALTWGSAAYFALLATRRLAALEAHMLQNLGSRCLRRAVLALSCVTGAMMLASTIAEGSNDDGSGGGSLLFVDIFLVLFTPMIIAWLLWSFARVGCKMLQASLTTGRRKQEVVLARQKAAMEFTGVVVTVATSCLRLVIFDMKRQQAEPCFGLSEPDVDQVKFQVDQVNSHINNHRSFYSFSYAFDFFDSWANAFGALMLSGAFSGALKGGEARRRAEMARQAKWQAVRDQWKPCEHQGWHHKVEELAHRGFTLAALLQFYKELPEHMPDFTPTMHRTADVVRRVIIPRSCRAGAAYSTIMMNNQPTLPMKMVTHNWSNLFRNLVAAIVADALDEDDYEQLADLLDKDVEKVQEWVTKRGRDEYTYWVCAFSVCQHTGICGSNPHGDRDPVSQEVHATCNCASQKHFNLTAPLFNGMSIGCEMNKFDQMMAYLSAHDPNFAQVVAVDSQFDLSTRAWCVSELAKAHAAGMQQHLKLENLRGLEENSQRLRQLRIQDMHASRPEDVAEILAAIPDVELFNQQLQRLLFDKLIPTWHNLDACEQLTVVGRIARWQTLVNSRYTTGTDRYRQDHSMAVEVNDTVATDAANDSVAIDAAIDTEDNVVDVSDVAIGMAIDANVQEVPAIAPPRPASPPHPGREYFLHVFDSGMQTYKHQPPS